MMASSANLPDRACFIVSTAQPKARQDKVLALGTSKEEVIREIIEATRETLWYRQCPFLMSLNTHAA